MVRIFFKIHCDFQLLRHSFTAFSAAVEPIEPTYNPAEDVNLILYTRNNRNAGVRLSLNAEAIRNSPFLASRPTRIITHGWLGDGETDFITGAIPAFLDNGDFNLIAIDWNAGAGTINYITAAANTRPTGEFVATFVDFMHENGFINFNTLKLVGFSLGGNFECVRIFILII